MLAQPEDENDEENDGEDDEEDVVESDEDGGEEEVAEGVDPNPSAKDENKDKDTSTVDDKKATDAPVKLVAPVAMKEEPKKVDTKGEKKADSKPPADKKNVQTGDIKIEEIPASHASASYGGDYTRTVPPQYTE